uniref:Transmembrane protein n=1 Tax=Macrostomum lignano TaxID=282301 RepID=A0A1I8FRH1_9PLAT
VYNCGSALATGLMVALVTLDTEVAQVVALQQLQKPFSKTDEPDRAEHQTANLLSRQSLLHLASPSALSPRLLFQRRRKRGGGLPARELHGKRWPIKSTQAKIAAVLTAVRSCWDLLDSAIATRIEELSSRNRHTDADGTASSTAAPPARTVPRDAAGRTLEAASSIPGGGLTAPCTASRSVQRKRLLQNRTELAELAANLLTVSQHFAAAVARDRRGRVSGSSAAAAGGGWWRTCRPAAAFATVREARIMQNHLIECRRRLLLLLPRLLPRLLPPCRFRACFCVCFRVCFWRLLPPPGLGQQQQQQ